MQVARAGMLVRLKRGINHTCPKGRENNRTATIKHVHGEDNDRCEMDRDLRGCTSWNIADLERVYPYKRTKTHD